MWWAIRQRRDKLIKILDRYRRECVRELTISFEHMVGELRQDLLEECQQHSLKALEGVPGVIKETFLVREMASIMTSATLCVSGRGQSTHAPE